jgi:L-rhamnose mutarotase
VSGFVQIRIYRFGNRLVMIQTIPADADLDEINRKYAATSERTKEWGTLMSKFQQPPPGAKPGEVWVEMNPIYDYENGEIR